MEKSFLTVVISYRIASTPEIVWDNVMDVSHFRHKHWKRFRDVNVVFREGDFEILQYRSYLLWPLPFTRMFLVARTGNRQNLTIRNVFQDLQTGSKVFLNVRIVKTDDGVEKIDHVMVERSAVAAFFPRLYVRLMLKRLTAMYLEDIEVWEERFARGGFSNRVCEPQLPALADDLGDRFAAMLEHHPENGASALRFELSNR